MPRNHCVVVALFVAMLSESAFGHSVGGGEVWGALVLLAWPVLTLLYTVIAVPGRKVLTLVLAGLGLPISFLGLLVYTTRTHVAPWERGEEMIIIRGMLVIWGLVLAYLLLRRVVHGRAQRT